MSDDDDDDDDIGERGEQPNDDDDDREESSIVALFDRICFSFGDQDAIVVGRRRQRQQIEKEEEEEEGDVEEEEEEEDPVCYLELQECSMTLAYQLHHRYRPDYVLVDGFGNVVAEAVALLACVRIGIPFVPVSVVDDGGDGDTGGVGTGGGRLKAAVDALRLHHSQKEPTASSSSSPPSSPMIVAVCCCDDDDDPRLGVFYRADVHPIVYVDNRGNLKEQIRVPSVFPNNDRNQHSFRDDLYVLFTSGTSGGGGAPKAVVGSHRSTYRRLDWFRSTYEASPRVGRRTKLTFVDGITELLGALLHPPSALLAVEPPERLHSEQGVLALLRMEPTQLTLLPSQLSQLLLLPPESLASLERIIVSGEPLSEALWNQVRTAVLSPSGAATGPRSCCRQFLNLYGQTESTGDILCADLISLGDRAVVRGVVAVGTPILPSIRVSANESQELIVSGNLANGYLLLDQSTASRFGASFPTGDVGFCQDSVWYVQGRCDDVAKINGVWTSPSEVEAAFAGRYSVAAHAVAAAILGGIVYLVSEKPVPKFSREHMRETGLPWNLIPRRAFCHTIPISQTGAGKVDRARLKNLLLSLLGGTEPVESDLNDVNSIVASVLKVSNVLDETKSFVEQGGDSASAVTLLYELRKARLIAANDFSAASILMCDSIAELNDVVCGKSKPKRLKLEDGLPPQTFVEIPTRRYSDRHVAVEFKACVDASPVLSHDGTSFYVGCQGGVVQKIEAEHGRVLALKHFCGWMIQADCVLSSKGVIVSLYKGKIEKGMVVSLGPDLNETLWKQEFDARIQATPVIMGNRDLCVSLGDRLVLLDLETGTNKCSIDLPGRVLARPAINVSSDVALYATSNSLVRVEWSSDARLQSVELATESIQSIGPVYKDLLCNPDSSAFISSSTGTIHCFPMDKPPVEGSTIHVSNFPLSAPARFEDACTVVGSYDGTLCCFGADFNTVWKLNVGGCVYAKPKAFPDLSCVACTTAGDVVQVLDGNVIWKYRVAAEIWSNPVLLGRAGQGSGRIAFGARDSRVHIVTIGNSRGS